MRFRLSILGLVVLMGSTMLEAQFTGDVLGMHSLGPGTKSPITGARSDVCAYCHAPHSGLPVRLWNQKLTTQTYSTYTSTTETNHGTQPTANSDSNHCLSCHDGTVAVGTTVVYGKVGTNGNMYSTDIFGSNLQTTHPFSMTTPLKDNIDLIASLVASGKTGDPTGKVKLIRGNVQCISCHNPHVQAVDLVSQNFLVKDSSSGQLCLACHDPTRSISAQVNPLTAWAASAHAISSDKITPQANVGSYTTVATNACVSCHTEHNASGAARLLRGLNEADCIACHNGGSNITGIAPYANVFSEYGKATGHPFPATTNPHDAAEPALLNNNRHATCVDCHNAHGSEQVTTFPLPPLLRVSQLNVQGISATDGVTVLTPAVNQYDNCLRCHGTSAGKQVVVGNGYFPNRLVSAGDPLNLIPQFATSATSSHPVMHTSSSVLAQPSLLPKMLNLDGVTQGRTMGNQLLCTDCHNSDDNREFGGGGPNGPHGSKWTHILERQYQFNQAASPGGTVSNLFPTPDLSVNGPYALCGKCHDLTNQIMLNTSWNQHNAHITSGFSCSVCHTAHGMGATSGNVSGERLVNFDANVVGANGNLPISYNRAANSCALVCHNVAHNADGSVGSASLRRGPALPVRR